MYDAAHVARRAQTILIETILGTAFSADVLAFDSGARLAQSDQARQTGQAPRLPATGADALAFQVLVAARRALWLPVEITVDHSHMPTVKATSPATATHTGAADRACCARVHARHRPFARSTDIDRLDMTTLANLDAAMAAQQHSILAAHITALEPAGDFTTTRRGLITGPAEVRQTVCGTSIDRPDVATTPALAGHADFLSHVHARASQGEFAPA